MELFENMIQKDFQGGVLVLKNGQVVFEYCQGDADYSINTPFTSHTTITLASLSKQFIAAAILLQIEQGNLSLDDTIELYFPQYPQGKSITIRQLLHHSSGIPDISVTELSLTQSVNMNQSTEQRRLMLSSFISALLRNAVLFVFQNALN